MGIPVKREDNPDANLPGPVMQPNLCCDDGLQQVLLFLGICSYNAIQTMSFIQMFFWFFKLSKRDARQAIFQDAVSWNDSITGYKISINYFSVRTTIGQYLQVV